MHPGRIRQESTAILKSKECQYFATYGLDFGNYVGEVRDIAGHRLMVCGSLPV